MPLNLREHNVMIRRMRNNSDAISTKEQRIVSSYDDFDRKNRIEALVKGLILDDFDLPLPHPRPESNDAAGDATKEDDNDEWENDFGEGSDCAAIGAASSNTSLAAKLANDDPPSASAPPSSPPPSTEASPASFATASFANDDDEEDVSVRRGSSSSSASSSSEPSYSSEYFSSSTDSEEMELSALARRHLSAVKAKWPRDDHHATKSKCSNKGICPPRRLHSPPPALPPTPPRSHLVEKPDRPPCSVERVSSDDPALHREALVRSHEMPSPAELTRSTGSSASVMSSDRNRRRVRFGCLEVRNYPIVLGDHPDCSAGPPISIGWKYSPGRTVSVDQYEAERSGSRRELDDMALSYMTRRKLLRRRRVSDEDMRKAAEEVCKVRKRRERTARWSTGKLARVDEVTESARKALGQLRPKMKRRSKSSSDVLQRSRSSSNILERTKSSPAVLETSPPKRTGRRSSV